MTCNEQGCANVVMAQNAFVQPLADISAAVNKPIADLTEEDLLLVASCDGCSALHVMCGEKVIGRDLYSVEASLAEIGRRKAERARAAAERKAQAEWRQEAAIRNAARHTLGAALLGLGFQPTVRHAAHAR